MNIVPIRKVCERKNYILKETMGFYPIFTNYKTSYNFANLKESLERWDVFSNNIGSNLNQILNILDVINEHGTKRDLQESVTIIEREVLPKLESPSFFRQIMTKRHPQEGLKETYDNIYKSITIVNECDRIIRNYNNISKRFNIEKVLNEGFIYKDDGISFKESINVLCQLVDTYNMNIPAKFTTTTELAMYIAEKTGNDIDQQELLESIIDYYAEIEKSNLDKYFDIINEAADKDCFINSTIVKEYTDHLKNVYYKMMNKDETIDYDQMILESYSYSPFAFDDIEKEHKSLSKHLQCLYEVAIVDRVKENIEKIKLAPVKSLTTLKETLRLMFVSNRLQDLKSGTKNGLSLCFYLFITVGSFAIGGPLAGALSIITNACLLHKANKEYLKNAIGEWKEHRVAVERKLQECNDNEKKMKLSKYLQEIDHNITILEKEYDSIRDDSVEELNTKINNRIINKNSAPDHLINPLGQDMNKRTSTPIMQSSTSTTENN